MSLSTAIDNTTNIQAVPAETPQKDIYAEELEREKAKRVAKAHLDKEEAEERAKAEAEKDREERERLEAFFATVKTKDEAVVWRANRFWRLIGVPLRFSAWGAFLGFGYMVLATDQWENFDLVRNHPYVTLGFLWLFLLPVWGIAGIMNRKSAYCRKCHNKEWTEENTCINKEHGTYENTMTWLNIAICTKCNLKHSYTDTTTELTEAGIIKRDREIAEARAEARAANAERNRQSRIDSLLRDAEHEEGMGRRSKAASLRAKASAQ